MKKVVVRYFALLREKAGLESETVETDLVSYRDLYQDLAKRHDFVLEPKMIQVAVDDEFSNLDREIVDGARIVFIPPVAGG